MIATINKKLGDAEQAKHRIKHFEKMMAEIKNYITTKFEQHLEAGQKNKRKERSRFMDAWGKMREEHKKWVKSELKDAIKKWDRHTPLIFIKFSILRLKNSEKLLNKPCNH